MEETAEKWATKHYETRNELQNYDQLGTPSMITIFQYLGLSWGESTLNVKAFSGLTFPPASSTTEPHVTFAGVSGSKSNLLLWSLRIYEALGRVAHSWD